MSLWLALLLACARHASPPPAVGGEPRPPEPALAGSIRDGHFIDDQYGLDIPILDGWEAWPGRRDAPLRVRLSHAASGAQVEVRVYEGRLDVPPPRPECSWTFTDQGRYRSLRLPVAVSVATCTPDNPVGVHVFATLVPVLDQTWDLEVLAPNEGMPAALRAAGALLSELRW